MDALSLTFRNGLATIASVLFVYLVGNAIYQLCFSPLRHIPGPWHAAVSKAWLTSHILRNRQSRAVQSLFEVYGPIVRIAPNRVAYLDVASNKRIYNSSKFPKGVFYRGFLANDNDQAMTLLEHGPHAIRKRAYAPHYTPSNLSLFQPETHDFVLDTVEILEKIGVNESIDVLHLFRDMMVDIICAASFSHKIGALQNRAQGKGVNYLVQAIDDWLERAVLRGLFPALVWNALYYIPNDRWKALVDSDKILATFVGERVRERHEQMKDEMLDEVEKKPMVQRLLEFRLPSGELLPEKDAISEHIGHFVAGVDTTSTLISYTCWELSRQPDISRKLHAELDDVMYDSKVIPDIAVLENLPYLNAVIKEGLRLYCPAPAMLDRVVPATDATSGPFELFGCVIPPGTTIATQAWSVHRNTAVFTSPETYLPGRWLDADDAQLAEMNAYMMPFGSGTRLCAGQHFAMQTARIAIATFARNFDIMAPLAETNDRTMEPRDAFVMFPAAMRCKLTFHSRVP
ncbi:cytochrome P450 [Peniophora sp. CONT]|nr:cytochrome P450 [Peniophora sp. CONT]